MNLTPRFIETIRVSPLTFRSLDVGVVLDMMIHDIDVVLSLAKSKLKSVEAVAVKVIGQSEDVCNARLVFENGCIATLTGSRLALKTDRRMRLATSDAWIAMDYAKKQGVIARRAQNLGDESASGSLAFRAGHQDRRVVELRRAKTLQ
jgi:predicted dehydrogenase